MNKNMNSPSKLTEFAPLSPEESQPVVASLFSKIFNFTKNSTSSSTSTGTSPNNDDHSSFGDSESWKQSDSVEKTPEDDNSSIINFPIDSTEGRSLPNVLKRISNILALKSNNLQSYKETQLRSYWMPDSVSKQCYECSERFTTFRRRHHCRVCGQIFCAKCCCDEIPGKIMGCTGDLRVCTYCCKVVLSYLESLDIRSDLSADLKALQEDLQVKYGSNLPPLSDKCNDGGIKSETLVRRKSSVGYMEEKYAIGRSVNSYLTMQERSIALQNSASLRMIYEELFHSHHAITLQTHRIRLKSYYNCFLGNELVNWMITQNKAATRIQAKAIGQALLEAGFIEPILPDNVFSDTATIFKPVKLTSIKNTDFLSENQTNCDAQEPAWVTNIPQHDSTTDSESEMKQPQPPMQTTVHLLSSSSSFYLDLNLESSTVTLKRPQSEDLTTISIDSSDGLTEETKENSFQIHDCNSCQKVSDELLNDSLQVQEFKERSGWHKVTNLRTTFNEMNAYNCLTAAFKEHESSLVKQLLNKEGVSQNWSEVILQIAHQIVDHVRPDLSHDADDMDIRHYVQIKKSPGGNKSDCEIVSGVVCSKNVAHRGMNAMIANPKILLLRCGLMYQRVEGKLLSLEPVMLQENEYLGHAVARITALGPDIVLVHRSVSRLAQDRLRENGVTLVLNVKLSVLERVARCTGANIVDTVDAHISARCKLGTCKKFYLRHFPGDRNIVKTLMYFEGCANPHLGSTILLRGGSQHELKKVKTVVFMMIFAAYSWRLEKSFLMDEFAMPPSPKDNSFLDETSNNDSPKQCDVQSSETNDSKTSVKAIEAESHVTVESTTISDNQIMNSEAFRPISAVLSESSNVYDTVKLFKRRSANGDTNQKYSLDKGSEDEEEHNSTLELFERSDSVADLQKPKLREKIPSEEKRVYGESISDRSDPLQSYLNDEGDEIDVVFDHAITSSPNGQLLSVADLPLLNKFKKALEDTILSFSPYLKFPIPYLETEAGRNCILRNFFPKDIYYSTYFLDKVEGTRTGSTSTEPVQIAYHELENLKLKPRHPFVEMKLTSSADSRQIQALLAHFRACGSRLRLSNTVFFPKRQQLTQSESLDSESRWPDCLDPVVHQRLAVLFCSFLHNSDNSPGFCVNPWIVNMDLYGRNDIALGRFLERYCLTTEYKCPAQTCREQIAQHARRFVHDGGCVQITLSSMSTETFSRENTNQILMWSKCAKCKSVSPVIPISDDTWSLSFAKYLELRFHGGVYMRRDTDTCQHSLHHDHYQYFSKKNMLAIFKFNKISQWEISLPPPLININYNPKQYTNCIEEMKSLALKGDEIFTLVKEKLSSLQISGISEPEIVNTYKQHLAKDQQYFKTQIEELQLNLTSPSFENKKGKGSEKHLQSVVYRVEDRLVILKRFLSEGVINWNTKILEISVKKKEETKPRKLPERTVVETDGYITEDTASESQLEDMSPVSADYNAVDAIMAVTLTESQAEVIENSDNEIISENTNPEDIVVVQGSPKTHQRSQSDVLIMNTEPAPSKNAEKKKKKTILSQLLQTAPTTNPIPNMLACTEHHLLPLGSVVPIVVYESEPSSIIAYALDSLDYKHALQELLRTTKGPELNPSPLNKRKFSDNKDNTSDLLQSGELKRPSVLSFLRGNSPNPASPVDSTEKNILNVDSTSQNSNTTTETDEEKKTTKQQNYIEIQFNDATTNFYCRVYFPVQFAALRENVLPCGEDGFTRSLSRSILWAARGGKSGSAFCKTRDDRFILKEMTRMDMQIFLEFAPNYFAYMEKCQQTKQPTLLGKIVGVYRVSFKNNTTNAALRTSVLVMENLFYNREITDKFDLKGSVRNRLVNLENVDHEGELVLLDENLLNMSCDSPLYIRSHSKAVLNKAIEEDTKFLADNCVMDYSLLVGLEPKSDELVLGIIDYLRTFTWDKKLETMVKKSGILGGQGKLPTIVSPAEYRDRFIVAMHRYFLPVPDRWMGLGRGVTGP